MFAPYATHDAKGIVSKSLKMYLKLDSIMTV